MRHYPHLWISARGLGLSGTSTHLTRQLSGTHYAPLRHPSAPGLSLTGIRLIILITHWGFPCCVRFPCVHAAATTPVQRTGALAAQTYPSVSAFPETTIGSVCTSSFSRIARRSFTLRPAHSRGHQNRGRYPKASDISSPPCLLRLLPAGAVAGRGLHPLKSAALSRHHTALNDADNAN